MFRRGRRGRGGGVLRKAWWWGTSIGAGAPLPTQPDAKAQREEREAEQRLGQRKENDAGTWSDGKLTTRIGRNSGDVRAVLRTFVRHGAPAEILTQGAPHLGTDGLIGILKSLRGQLTELGVDLRFGTRLLGLETEDGACVGVRVLGEAGEATLKADAVVCAAGHSADDVYDALEAAGAKLEAKPVAVRSPRLLFGPSACGLRGGVDATTARHRRDPCRETRKNDIGRLPRRAPPIFGQRSGLRRPRLPGGDGQF